jgi:imidazolonepropionase
MNDNLLVGPFAQLITMDGLPLKGPLQDDQLQVIPSAGVVIKDGKISALAPFKQLKSIAIVEKWTIYELEDPYIAMPGLIDAHTHLCYAGSRANDYAMRLSGLSYLDIAASGGGIWSTVQYTRNASFDELYKKTQERALSLLRNGVTTAEVKSGYALEVEGEVRMLQVINQVDRANDIDLVPTCLAAHILPQDFYGSKIDYLNEIATNLLPIVAKQKLASRVDIFIEKSAFLPDESLEYLRKAKKMGFDITVHADQFTTGGTEVACIIGAISADHLEASNDKEITMLANSNVVPVCLPGSAIGLGNGFAPARKILDAGASLALASDWNPGSAPMGNLLIQASIMGAYQHLSMAETLAAVTFRAAAALNLFDRGIIKQGNIADIIAFPTNDYREVLYNQGAMKPTLIWKRGKLMSEV